MLKKIELPLQWIIFHKFVIHFTAKNMEIIKMFKSERLLIQKKL